MEPSTPNDHVETPSSSLQVFTTPEHQTIVELLLSLTGLDRAVSVNVLPSDQSTEVTNEQTRR
jgi:hypothetical protein